MKKVKEIVVISGKGGTGKTTVTASLADLIPGKIIVDADVDAANLYLLLNPEHTQGTDFIGKPTARIDADMCTSCGRCKELCRFDAINIIDEQYIVDDFSCDGCGLCEIACPVKAVQMNPQVVGKWFVSRTPLGDFVHARLIPGAENSGSLVTKVRQQAKQAAEEKKIEALLIDGPPGIGCPVIAAAAGAHLAVMVTEPTYSAINDLKRLLKLTTHFRVKSCIVINRFDINRENTRQIENFAQNKGVPVIARIPHSRCVMEEIAKSSIPSRKCSTLSREVEKIYEYIKNE
jgi:MinD superfamily P-loop ATPase